ncbi:MAG: hypothetical protein CMJ19_12835 [Phycisphaeraceae bacterium]|nr:hypothetical protein [Phycisphaeraceae bacterium]
MRPWQKYDLKSVIQELNFPENLMPIIGDGWQQSMDAACDDIPEFLCPEQYTLARQACSIDAQVDEALHQTAKLITASPALTALAWHAYYQNFMSNTMVFKDWPRFNQQLGDALAGMFYLIVGLGHVPLTQAKHQQLGIEPQVTHETLLELKGFNQNHQLAHGGHPGVLQSQFRWLSDYPKGRLFRLGRLEFCLEPLPCEYQVFEHRQTKHKLLLAPDAVRYDGQGYVDGIHAQFDQAHGWTSKLVFDQDHVTGHPIHPNGHAIANPITLNLTDWQCVLKPGDMVLNMHIPPGGGMSLPNCLSSFKQAQTFFPKHFPDELPKAIVCQSWILNPAFDTALPDSNMAKLLRELYLYPIPTSGRSGLNFVFLKEEDEMDPATLPRDSSLQRYMVDCLENGHPLRGSGMMLFFDDLPNFGNQTYRKQWEQNPLVK